jgi:hypothetical protein
MRDTDTDDEVESDKVPQPEKLKTNKKKLQFSIKASNKSDSE